MKDCEQTGCAERAAVGIVDPIHPENGKFLCWRHIDERRDGRLSQYEVLDK